ncbi:uncharacterized protein TM35_000181520 [Trypanosoma theileri]|uniref:Uncharacterized protein n=1 Tax=Trypanosoma theileri TaxID=67003 RepID=A0A1X0NTR8_9TRYP|nr:uncharacterized protein TM35_000181520 [Trypanosoma theileri]ORC88095.1 hypothetical protein TM35_000181520 [Trypanosoma theileri]
MNLSNYMSTIMSEARQFGKAYVDSLVSPGDGKDHETSNGLVREKRNKEEEEVVVAPSFSSISHCRNIGTFNDRKSNDKYNTMSSSSNNNNNSGSSSSGSGNNSYSLSQKGPLMANGGKFSVSSSHPSPLMVDLDTPPLPPPPITTTSDNTTNTITTTTTTTTTMSVPEAVMLTTGVRKNIGKKTKASRSKFGAVKIELESMDHHKPSVMPTSSTPVQISHEPPKSFNDNKSNNTSIDKESLQASQETTLLKDVSTNNNNNNENEKNEKKLKNWFKKRDTLLHLLYKDLDKRARPPLSEWAQNVIRDFVKRIMEVALNFVVNDKTLLLNSKSIVSTSLDISLEETWRNSEIVFRSSLTHAIPPEVFTPLNISKYDISTTNNTNTNKTNSNSITISGNVNAISRSLESYSKEGTSCLHQALWNAAQRAQQWCGEGHLKMLLIPSSLRSIDTVERGITEFLDSCFGPILFLTAEYYQKWIQSHLSLQEMEKEKEKEKDSELEIWAKEMMRIFSLAIMEVDVQSQQMISLDVHVEKRNREKIEMSSHTSLQAAVEKGTSALWLMREATLLTVLFVRVLRIGVLCEVE